jgi:hypothetical protein
MSAPDPDLNPVSVAVLVLTAIVGPQFATVAGAYTVILFGWFGGVIVGALRMPHQGRMPLGLFVLLSLIVTMGATVPLSDFLSLNTTRFLPGTVSMGSAGLLFPVAFALPAIGHSWVGIVAWCVMQLRRRLLGNQQQDKEP